MSRVENINPETAPIPAAWVPQVITGGKGPPEPPKESGYNYLKDLEVGSYFGCKPSDKSVDWELYSLVAKASDNMYFLKWHVPDGKVYERTVDPKIFCNLYRDHKLLWVFRQQQEEEDGSD